MITMELNNSQRRRALSQVARCELTGQRVLNHLADEIEEVNYTIASHVLDDRDFGFVRELRLNRRELYRQWHKMARLMQTAAAIKTALQISLDYLTLSHDQAEFLAAWMSREQASQGPWLLEQLNTL